MNKFIELKTLLNPISQILTTARKEKDIYQKFCDNLVKIDDYSLAWISNLNYKENKIETAARSGPCNDCILSMENSMKNIVSSQSVKTIKPVIIRNIKNYEIIKSPDKEELLKECPSFISLPIRFENKTVVGYLNICSTQKDPFNNSEVKLLNEITKHIAIGVKSLRYEEELIKKDEKYKKILYQVIDSIVIISERRDFYTSGHQNRVAILSSSIAKKMNLDKSLIEGIYITSLMHDIGKIAIPLSILSKPTHLSQGELMIIRNHPMEGFDILNGIEFPWPVSSIILQHHERINGSGYPSGLGGKDILLEAKILAVADVIEAMSAHRPYRPALGLNKAIAEIIKNKGILYDSDVVEACLKVLREKKNRFLKLLF
jgi:HD-GYP domain-containing protein (c-di-GMP phosphodiesterase class II)